MRAALRRESWEILADPEAHRAQEVLGVRVEQAVPGEAAFSRAAEDSADAVGLAQGDAVAAVAVEVVVDA